LLAEARGELEDKEELKQASGYEAEAANLREQTSKVSVDRARRAEDRARLTAEIARLRGESTQLAGEQAESRIASARMAVAAAEIELGRAYQDCLARGFTPHDTEGTFTAEGTAARSGLKLHLRRLLAGYRADEDVASRATVERMAEAVVGMLQ